MSYQRIKLPGEEKLALRAKLWLSLDRSKLAALTCPVYDRNWLLADEIGNTPERRVYP